MVTSQSPSNTNALAGVQAVFDIYELLESIIVLIPARQIRELRGVTKTLKQLITSSSRIRKARCLLPIRFTIGAIPVYELGSSVILHPIFTVQRYALYDDKTATFLCGTIPLLHVTPEQDMRAYATNPPCQIMDLKSIFTWQHCTLYVKGGIKVLDVLEVGSALASEKYVSGNTAIRDNQRVFVAVAETSGPAY